MDLDFMFRKWFLHALQQLRLPATLHLCLIHYAQEILLRSNMSSVDPLISFPKFHTIALKEKHSMLKNLGNLMTKTCQSSSR